MTDGRIVFSVSGIKVFVLMGRGTLNVLNVNGRTMLLPLGMILGLLGLPLATGIWSDPAAEDYLMVSAFYCAF